MQNQCQDEHEQLQQTVHKLAVLTDWLHLNQNLKFCKKKNQRAELYISKWIWEFEGRFEDESAQEWAKCAILNYPKLSKTSPKPV